MTGSFASSWRDVQPGTKSVLGLDVSPLPTGGVLQLAVLVARGVNPGPTIVVLGGVHGDEYEGIAAVRSVFRGLDAGKVSGTFLGVPMCNPPAFGARSRTSPLDGQNLARVFPGRPDGTVSEQIAHVLTTDVLSWADFIIDLHSSGSYIAMPLLVGYRRTDDAAGERSRQAALRFGVATIWGHETMNPGRTLTEPHGRGVPWLYTESPSGGWLHTQVAEIYAAGVVNVMRYLRMLDGEAPLAAVERELSGDGNIDGSLTAPVSGFLTWNVDLLDQVAAGDLLGTVEDPAGETLAEIRAPTAGVVALRRNSPSVTAGDLVFLVT